MKKNILLLAAAIVAAMLMQVGCTPEETTTIAPGGNPLTEAEVAPVKPTSLVGTEWVEHFNYQNTILGTYYDIQSDDMMMFRASFQSLIALIIIQRRQTRMNTTVRYTLSPIPMTLYWAVVNGIIFQAITIL